MVKVSAKGAQRAALGEERAALRPPPRKAVSAVTRDSFINFMQGVGLGAGNSLTGGTYGFNPITRNRILIEWIHRGSWLGGMAVDVIGDDMTRKGAEITSDMEPEDILKIESELSRLLVWDKINQTIKWGRLYGGSLGVALIDGQDLRTPLRLETVGKGQFRGILPLDRWMVTPSLEDLVTELGPHLGQPKYYRVQENAPALRGEAIHYSRILIRQVGVELPYQQALTENLWGISIYERFYDRMVAFDQATMGAAQLVSKSYLRTLKIEDLRQIVASGGELLAGLVSYIQQMRAFQSNEGVTTIDSKDEFEVQQTSAFSGVDSVIQQLSMQLSGALGIPLVRLLGQSPAGLSATGESDWRNYYDNILSRQEKDIGEGVPLAYKLTAQSLGIKVPDDFQVAFRPLKEMDEKEKSEIANFIADAVTKAKDAGLMGTQTAMRELKQSSTRTGVFGNISEEAIDNADDEIAPPLSEQLLSGMDYGGGAGKPGYNAPKVPMNKEADDGKTGSQREAATMDSRPRRRVEL